MGHAVLCVEYKEEDVIRLPGYQKCPTCGSNLHVLSSKPINPDDPEALATMCFEAVNVERIRKAIDLVIGLCRDLYLLVDAYKEVAFVKIDKKTYKADLDSLEKCLPGLGL
jgi:hypothetical protein